MTELPRTLTDAADAIRRREVSSVELLEAAFRRADVLDHRLGVYLHRFDEQALATAAQADADLAAGLDKGPLHGVPIGIKDNLAVSEGPTTANSLVLDPAWGKGRDAIVIERLKQAGAVITGKLTTMEYAIGAHDPSKPHPRPRNPWNLDAWPGGSSSGTGAGVAAGLFLAGLGTDTGGSIRLPAAYCGVCGLTPTYGRVPTAGCVPLGYTLDHIGPLARSAVDCGVVLAAISGEDPRDPYTVATDPVTIKSMHGSLKGVTIGVERVHHLGADLEDPALAPTFQAAVEVLRGLGATVVDVELDYFHETVTAQVVTMCSEAFAYHRLDVQTRWSDYYRSTRAFLAAGALFTSADYVQAQRVRRVAQRSVARIFETVDVVVTPTAGTGAASWDELDSIGFGARLPAIFTPYWSSVGNPALVVPMGLSTDGMPLSLQLAGRPFAEGTLIAVADAYQGATDWHNRTAPMLADIAR